MRIIGLTGGIACGKTNVSDTLARLGAAIVDGDKLSRELTAPGGPALPAIRAAFGDGVFTTDGQLNRKALGAVVFGNKAELDKLNTLMRPLLRRLIAERIEEARATGFRLCVLDMPLLYEEGLDSLCEAVWCVTIPAEEQLRRLMVRDGCTEAAARARIASQLPAAEKAARADVVIDTSGTIEETQSKIPPLYQAELEKEGSHVRGADPASPSAHPAP